MRTLYSLFLVCSTASSFSQLSDPFLVTNPPISQNEMFVMDIEGDGDLDIITTDGGFVEYAYYNSMGYRSSEFRIGVNDGLGVFTEQPLIQLSTPSFWSFGDVDADGKLDFVFSDTEDVYYMHNSTGLQFDTPELIFQSNDFLDCSTMDEYEFSPIEIRRVGLGDLDNDGDGDLVISTRDNYCAGMEEWEYSANRIYTMQWNGSSFDNFSFLDEPLFLSASTNVGGIQISDVNADGINDIIYLNGPDMSTWELVIYYGTGNVMLFDSWAITAWDEITFGQLDGDEALEAVGLNLMIGPNLIWEEIDLVDEQFLYYQESTAYNPNDISSARLGIMDLYGDGLPDVVLHSLTGELYLHINTDGNYPFNATTMATGIANYTNLRTGDMNGDEGDDLLIMNEGNVYVLYGQTALDPQANVTFSVFYDTDGDGVLDNGEIGLANQQLTFDNGLHLFTNQDGDAGIVLEEGNYTITASVDETVFSFSTSNQSEIVINANSADTTIYFGVVPAGGPIDSLICTLIENIPFCNAEGSYSITVLNSGNTMASGTIEFELDLMMSYLDAYPSPLSISGNTIVWEFQNLQPSGVFFINLSTTSPPVEEMGNAYQNAVTAQVVDNNENVLFESILQNAAIVTCSYDPNDITEHNGFTDQGYIFDGDQLEYTIRFQNTGNAPATNVRIENQLSDLLNRNTLQPIAWSHNFDLVIGETGKAIFSFSNINLTDSVNNEPESHGFVTYRIHPLSGLVPTTLIENTAEIYFDFNPTVVTNTEINTIYDCADLSQNTISATEACADEIITGTNNAQWVEEVSWNYNEQIQSGASIDLVLVESGVLSMTASNSLCNYDQQWTLTVISTEANFVVNGNVLTANDGETFQWYLNEMPIENASQQNYEISQTGSYQVMVTNAQGCAEISESTQVTYTGIPVFSLSESYLYPNPMRDQATLKLPEGTWVVSVVDVHGKLVYLNEHATGSILLQDTHLIPGCYLIQLNGKDIQRNLKLLVADD